MKNKKGLLIDAAAGLLLTAVVAFGYFSPSSIPFLQDLEFKSYDFRSKLRTSLNKPDKILLVTIDDDSIAQIGRWPWPRSRIAAAVDKIASEHPRVIGLDILYSEAERDPGLSEIKRLQERYDGLVAAKTIVQKPGADFDVEFASSTAALDTDSRLVASIKAAGNVILPLFFVPNPPGQKANALPPEVSSSAITAKVPPGSIYVEDNAIAPLVSYAAAAAGVAHSAIYPETDGVVRRDALLIGHDGVLYPSFALSLALAAQGFKPSDLSVKPGVEISAASSNGSLRVPLDADGMMWVSFLGTPEEQTINRVSFQTVLGGGSLAADYFKDKIVIIGPTARGLGNEHSIPLGGRMADVEIGAHTLANILDHKFLTRPAWAEKAEWGVLAAIGLFLMLLLPRLKAFWGLVASLLLSIAIAVAGTYFFVAGQWLKIGYPLALLLSGYLVIVSRQFLLTEKGKELVEASAIETNKMLGLSFQGQGMLDLAFEKFRLCPLDSAMKELLYNLGLDFERKRMHSKAAAVFEHIQSEDATYKDVSQKIEMLKAAAQGAVFGGVGKAKDNTVLLTGVGGAKPTLGRYEIEKELGRGAMGIVYLGRDPKINRQVAIKTMMLEEVEGSTAKEVKERFFREAESAGTLNHPNIVRIFDAGEENDVAYIAMELLDGHDLTRYCQKDALLPIDKVLEYVATVADALDYAHRQGIVHRDIKPANVMLLKDGSIRVADFGIARITASSKTASGTVMGTPSYMSPEQVAGRKVDGRSDLFSLSVALFELLTGDKPFKGGDGIGALLFQIANDPHPDPRSIRPEIPPSLKAVIDKGLVKNAANRYQKGSELATALRSVLAQVKAGALETILPTAPLEEKRAPTYVPPPEKTEERTAPVPAVPIAGEPADPGAPVAAEDSPAAALESSETEYDQTAAPAEGEAAPAEAVAAEGEAAAAEGEAAPAEAAYDPDKTITQFDSAEGAEAEQAALPPGGPEMGIPDSEDTLDKTITSPVPAIPGGDAGEVPAAETEPGMRIELGPRPGFAAASPASAAEEPTQSAEVSPDAAGRMPPRRDA